MDLERVLPAKLEAIQRMNGLCRLRPVGFQNACCGESASERNIEGHSRTEDMIEALPQACRNRRTSKSFSVVLISMRTWTIIGRLNHFSVRSVTVSQYRPEAATKSF